MGNSLQWIETTGGPLVLLRKSLIPLWNDDPLKGSLTDYHRACSVTDEVGVISVNSEDALILGDEPNRTAIIFDDMEVLFVRWRWADSEEAVVSALQSGELRAAQFDITGNFHAMAEEYLLFDSSLTATELGNTLAVKLTTGTYSIETLYFRPDPNLFLLIHRLRLI